MTTVTVKLFAIYREVIGSEEISLEFPADAPVSNVLDVLIDRYPQLARWRSITQFGIDREFVTADTMMSDGNEIVLIPPVSGG
jgi:molybdopterin synthase sulfur carrier subunit